MINCIESPLRMPPSTATRGLWVMQCLLGFMGGMLLLFGLALETRSAQWIDAVAQQIVFEIPAAQEANVQKLHAVLQKQDALSDVKLLRRGDIEKQLKGWIDNARDLPLPVLIQAQVKPQADLTTIQYELGAHFPGVVFHLGKDSLHAQWQQIFMLRLAAYGMVIIVIVVGAAMSLTTVYWRLDVQEDILDLLHSMGASRTYIIKELARANGINAIFSSGVGLLIGLALCAVARLYTDLQASHAINLLSLQSVVFAMILPVLMACAAILTTIYAVYRKYRPFRGSNL